MVGNTPAIARVRQLANDALNDPDGLRIMFSVAHYGDLDAANSAALSFQRAFSSVRARSRRKAIRSEYGAMAEKFATMDTDLTGPYDVLACSKHKLAHGAGYEILLVPAAMLDFANDVVNARTGEPLKEYTREFQESNAILQFWLRKGQEATNQRKPFTMPLSEHQVRQWFTHEPEYARYMFEASGFTVPDWAPAGPERVKSGSQIIPSADATLDEDYGADPNIDLFTGKPKT